MNKTRSMLVFIMSAAAVAVAEPPTSTTPPAAPVPPAPPANMAPPPAPGQPPMGPRSGAPGNPAMMRRFMGADSEGMIVRMLGEPRTVQELGLSDAQAKELKDGNAKFWQEVNEMNSKLEHASMQRSELWKADSIDEEAIMKAVGETAEMSAQIAKLRAKQAITALKVLTPEQRVKFRETMKQPMGQGPQWTREGIRQPGAFQGRGASPVVPPVPKPPAPATAPATPPAAQ